MTRPRERPFPGRNLLRLFFALALVALVAAGFFDGLPARPEATAARVVRGLLGLALLALLAYDLAGLLRHPERADRIKAAVSLSLAALVVAHALGPSDRSFAFIYLAVALTVTVTEPEIGLMAGAYLLVAEALWTLFAPGASGWTAFAQRAGLTALFALGAGVFTLSHSRRRQGLEAELRRLQAGLADLDPDDTGHRLSGLTDAGKEKAAIQTARRMEKEMAGALEQGRLALRADGLALYWRPGPEGPLRLRGLASRRGPERTEAELTPGQGLLGLAVERTEPLRVAGAKRLRGALPHRPYARSEHLLAAPVYESANALGLLAADRERDEAFGEDDERLLLAVANQVREIHGHARRLRRTEDEGMRFKSLAELSHRLSRTLELSEILDAVVAAGTALTGQKTMAVTLGFDSEPPALARAVGAFDPRRLRAPTPLEGTLVGLALRERQPHSIPNLFGRERKTPALGPGLDPPGMRSLLIQPLPFRGDAQGALCFFAPKPEAFSRGTIAATDMLADLAAVAIDNALLYRGMEEKALRDGLTGLYNHRWFQQRLREELERAERLRTRVAMVLCDIDRFKRVNDAYGHPVGDEVLRGVARTLAEAVRKTDSAARYGGEEFALVLVGTDAKGAKELAERIRREVARLVFQGGGREFKVTISLGIAVYPDDTRGRAELIAKADQALYRAKEKGRNRTLTAAELDAR